MRKQQLELRLVQAGHPDFRTLVRALDRDYVDRFGAVALQYRQYNGLDGLEQVCLCMEEGKAVACGAFQRLDEDAAELKRVYVLPAYRRRGIARQLVEVLELQALFAGYTRMALETGREMPEAISLYTALGYRETAPWGPFVGDGLCVCMEKTLEE